MASLCSLLASSSSALCLPSLASGSCKTKCRPTGSGTTQYVAARAAAAAANEHEAVVEAERETRRRMVMGVVAAAAMALSGMAKAEETSKSKQKNKCPTICAQNRTASCCFGT